MVVIPDRGYLIKHLPFVETFILVWRVLKRGEMAIKRKNARWLAAGWFSFFPFTLSLFLGPRPDHLSVLGGRRFIRSLHAVIAVCDVPYTHSLCSVGCTV